MSAMVRVSIITPCLNRADLVAEAVRSAQDQAGVEVEHIVVDGGSTDGTLEVLAEFPHLRVISLPGSGPEEALDRGIRDATGDVIGFLMTDDRLAPGILARVATRFVERPDLDIVSCGCGFFTSDESGIERVIRVYQRRDAIDLDYRVVLLGPLMACARFYRKSVFDRIGFFGQDYRYCNDRAFLWRAIAAGLRNACLEEVAYWYRSHPGSSSIGQGPDAALAMAEEHMTMAEAFLRGPDRAQSIHRIWLKRFHALECARGVVRALRCAKPAKAFALVMRGFSTGIIWPFTAWKELVTLRRCRASSGSNPLTHSGP